jgi:hypothetical protein
MLVLFAAFAAGIVATFAALFVWSWLTDDPPPKLHWMTPDQVAKLAPDQQRRVMQR